MNRNQPRAILVLTVVHHPEDSRIRYRQIAALLDAGWRVTYAAPWSGYGLAMPPSGIPGLRTIDVRRAHGRRRLRALRQAIQVLRAEGPAHDLILVHDPELLLAVIGQAWGHRADLPPVVWDVHEDTAAAVEVKAWIPRVLRPALATAVRTAERVAERRVHLLLADHHYARRFRRQHPVVPNVTTVPARLPGPPPRDPGTQPVRETQRVVYLGSNTIERGAAEMVEIARQLPDHLRVEIIGPAHGRAEALLRAAHEDGVLDWVGFLPAQQAVQRLEGALAGLCLLHDEANFRPSMATKVVEYLSRGVPAIVTPLPVQQHLVARSRGGVVVPFGSTTEVVSILLAWADDPSVPRELGRRGHAYVAHHHNWGRLQGHFVAVLDRIASGGG